MQIFTFFFFETWWEILESKCKADMSQDYKKGIFKILFLLTALLFIVYWKDFMDLQGPFMVTV